MSLLSEVQRIAETWQEAVLEGTSISVSFTAKEWNNFKSLIQEEVAKAFPLDVPAVDVVIPVATPVDTPVPVTIVDTSTIVPVAPVVDTPVEEASPVDLMSDAIAPDDIQH